MLDIGSEIILQRKMTPIMYVYIMIIIVIMLSLIIVFILFRYRTYYEIRGVVEEDNSSYYVRCYIPIDYLKYITNNNIVKIDDNYYDYSIVSIDSEYFTDEVNTYQVVKIQIIMSEKYKFNNLTLNLKFLKDDKRIIDYISK